MGIVTKDRRGHVREAQGGTEGHVHLLRGELRQNHIAAYHLTIRRFAEKIGVAPSKMLEVVEQKIPLDEEMIAALAKGTETTPEYWQELQERYDLSAVTK